MPKETWNEKKNGENELLLKSPSLDEMMLKDVTWVVRDKVLRL